MRAALIRSATLCAFAAKVTIVAATRSGVLTVRDSGEPRHRETSTRFHDGEDPGEVAAAVLDAMLKDMTYSGGAPARWRPLPNDESCLHSIISTDPESGISIRARVWEDGRLTVDWADAKDVAL